MRDRIVLVLPMFFLASILWGQQLTDQRSAPQQPAQPGTPAMNMDMSNHDMSNTKNTPKGEEKDSEKDSDSSMHAMHSMEGHMDMGPHMKMTALRAAKPGDAARAQGIAAAARKASERYLDYHVALNEGFKIFHPEIPQKMYHFTNYGYGMEAFVRFNPDHPTSLLYEKHGDDYKLIGVMYTAPKRLTEDQLDERIPLSVAQWHEHVNFCAAPAGRKAEYLRPRPQFGLRGSITTEEACSAAGGSFHPIIFNWMVHVYPFEKDQASIWSVNRQHSDAD
jgi:hypothetical protein